MASAQLKLELDLGETFVDEVRSIMKDEIEVASRKWNHQLTPQEKKDAVNVGFAQLEKRINSVSNGTWDRSNVVLFSIPGGPAKQLAVPSAESNAEQIQLTRSRDGWICAKDEGEDAFSLKDFPGVFRAQVDAWARTAIFYSVGSYKN